MIKVSVIVPIYNQKKLVIEALNSIPKRSYIEAVLVMNGVDDEMKSIIYNYCKNDPFYKVVDVKEPLGCWGAMNVGLEYAKGDYIYQLDEDDTLVTDNFVYVVKSYLGSDLVYVNLKVNDGSVWHINEENRFGISDHTSLIKRSFLGNEKFDTGDMRKIDGGYKLFQRLKLRKHTRTFTDIVVYNYNFPRVDSLYYKATHR